jgi:hypothetical protein
MTKRIEKGIKLGRLRTRYKQASDRKKSKILDELVDLYSMNRKYLIRLLNDKAKRAQSRKGPKKKYDDPRLIQALEIIWLATDQMCSKKLKSALSEWLPFYELENSEMPSELRKKILAISPSTIDRMLQKNKSSTLRRKLCGTKPGSIIKNQIPIKTNQWNETEAGFIEADTVAHCGNSLSGNFVWSVTATDILTSWTENRAVWNKGAEGVLNAIQDIESTLPFILKGFDCDNGSEFLNYHLIRYFSEKPKEMAVQFTRSRPYKKNDNAHVEQKNWTHVRNLFGYYRLDKSGLVAMMNDLYKNEWSLYQNHFIPNMKCIKKEKINSKYRKHFDEPKTAYERVLNCKSIDVDVKEKLKKKHKKLNPFELKRNIETKLKEIFKHVELNQKGRTKI